MPPRDYDFWEYKLFPEKGGRAIHVTKGELKLYELTEERLQRGSFLKYLPNKGKPWPEQLDWRMAVRDNRLERV